jgi:putative Mg2+ transporter-C (MgtC) family protein
LDADILGFAGRILLAALLGGLIGMEREVDGHPAGLRTHITVALGAALFGIISVDGFDRMVATRAETNVQVDVTRVASQVVVGIGFLGAGTIIKNDGAVRGLTTAASLWVASAVGLGVGVGAYGPAVLTAVALLAALVGLRFPRRWLRDYVSTRRRTVTLRLVPGADTGSILAALDRVQGVEVRNLTVRGDDEGGRVMEVELKPLPGGDVDALVASLTTYDGVDGVEVT